ncbi:MAG: helix-turn-helix transcriptional regulator [Campylobacterales bacterium]|nr:helix-turn-helix transcriptional regulator [Campylobacterales bacterium]
MKNLSIVTEEELENFYHTISKNIKTIRTEKKKPQLDLVLEMGLKSTSFYSKCENSKNNHHFNLEHLYKIAVALDIDIIELFQGIKTTK